MTVNSASVNSSAVNAAAGGLTRVATQCSQGYVLSVKVVTAVSFGYSILFKAKIQNKQRFGLGIFPAKQISHGYDIEGLRKQTSQGYWLTLGVKKQVSQGYGIRIALQHVSRWGARAKVQHVQPIQYGIRTYHAQGYALLQLIAKQNTQEYDLDPYDRVEKQTSQGYSLRVSAQYQQGYSLHSVVNKQVSQEYTETNVIKAQHEAKYDLRAFNRVQKRNRGIYSLLADMAATLITTVPHITFEGEDIKVVSFDIGQEEGSVSWTSNIELADVGQWQKFSTDSRFTLTIGSDVYELMVSSKSLVRSKPAKVKASISGVSLCAVHDVPRAAVITKVWSDPVWAKDAAEEVLGVTIDWRIVNWLIPAYRLGVDGVAPMAVVQLIATAAGGIVAAKIDGTLEVRPRFPIQVETYGTASPDQVYTDADDNISVSEEYKTNVEYNQFVIRDMQEVNNRDRIEYDADDSDTTKGVLRVYPAPYRDVAVLHTGAPEVILLNKGDNTRELVETVEITAGSGLTRYPVHTIVNTAWKYENLGGVVFDGANVECSIGEHSLLELTYTTKSKDYDTQHVVPEQVQFIVEDD